MLALLSFYALPSGGKSKDAVVHEGALGRKTFLIDISRTNKSSIHDWQNDNLFKMGPSRPLFVYFRPFLITISIIQSEKIVDGLHKI